MTKAPSFKADGPIQAEWPVAPCELATLEKVRLVRLENRPMDYALVPDKTNRVQVVKWKTTAKPSTVNLLKKGDLESFAECADGGVEKLIEWTSQWGLLGFRLVGNHVPSRFMQWIYPGSDRFFGPEHRVGYGAEPLELIQDAARVAKAAASLFHAMRLESIHERAKRVRQLISPNSQVEVGPIMEELPDGRKIAHGPAEREYFVHEVSIGMQQVPCKDIDYDRLAIAGLGAITDLYLGGEFQLYWSEHRGKARRLDLGWKINSLLGTLYFKMGMSKTLRTLACKVCRAPLGHRRTGAQTCGATCRKQLQRKRGKTMKPSSIVWLLVWILATVAVPCSAGQRHYECSVLTASQLTAEGTIASHWSVQPHVGQKFTVDRETGRVIGGPLDNAHMKIEVVDSGSGEMSFQVFARSTQRPHTSYLEIEEFRPVEQKPFLGTTTLYYPGVYSGICK